METSISGDCAPLAAKKKRGLSPEAEAGPLSRAPGPAKKRRGLPPEEEEELSSFTPKSPISMPYIPDELNDPTAAAYSAALAAFKEAQVKYYAKLGI
jgi:hypothetical protein